MRLSIVIPAFNEEKYLPRCLESIVKGGTGIVDDIIVVDNASTDRTAEVARSFPGVRVVREEKKSLLFARQCGLQAANTELIAYVDADCEAPPQWFGLIKPAFEDPKVVCLSGPYDYRPGELSSFQMIGARFYCFVLAPLVAFVLGYAVLGGNFVVRRSALEAIGGFDTSINFHGEDTNIARRLHKVGKVKYSTKFLTYTSARRLRREGYLKTAAIYIINFLSESLFHRPISKTYEDIR